MSIRWGIVGCGEVCEVKSGPAFYKATGSTLGMVMRRDAGRAQDFARRHGVERWTTDAEALINDPQVDAVYIATPPKLHLDYALAVARANKPCYVEKPMARNLAECEAMIEAFAKCGQPLYVGYYRRALPRFLKVRELLGARVLGEVLAVSHVYQGRVSRAPGARAGWREDVAQSGGGLFVDLGSHVVDLLDFLLGPLLSVSGLAAHRSSGGRVPAGVPEDTVVMSFRTESGVLGSARYQFHTAGTMDRLEFVGTRGRLSLSVFGQEPLELEVGDGRESISVDHPAHVHLPLVQSIVDELGGRARECTSTGRSGARASAVIDRVLDGYYGGRADAFWLRPETWPGVRGG
jgi:1,5-anhydro-D-fructose reductase (1,5-anhydro-D-mannitol-forming)